MKWYKMRRPHYHSLRDLLFVVIVVAVLSALITYQLTTRLPMKSQAELTILLEERNYHLDKRRGLEGIDLEKVSGISQADYSRQWEKKHQLDITTITEKIKKIEEDWFGRMSGCKTVVVEADTDDSVSSAVVIQTSTQLSYTQLFKRLKCRIMEIDGKDFKSLKREDNTMVWIIGSNTTTLKDDKFSHLYSKNIKVNNIPMLQAVLQSKESLCEMPQRVSDVADMDVESIIPGCFSLPSQYSQFVREHHRHEYNQKWIYKGLGPGQRKIHLLDLENAIHAANIQSWSEEKGLLQEYFGPPLLFYGMPFEVKVYVLVTSLSPLRVYVHTEGVVQSRHDYQRYFKKVDGRSWSFNQLRGFMANRHGSKAAEAMVYNTHSLIVQTLLILEVTALNVSKSSQKSLQCDNCFQLLEFDIIFNTSFHPVLLEIVMNPRMDIFAQQKEILKDTVSILTANLPVYKEIAMMYRDLNFHLDRMGETCYKEEGHLSEEDLRYIMVTRKEYLGRGRYNMIYPSANIDSYTLFISALKQHFFYVKLDLLHKSESSESHSTVVLHSTLSAILKYFSNRDVLGDSYDDDLSMFYTQSHSLRSLFHHVKDHHNKVDEVYNRKHCSQDIDSMPYLQSFHTEPALNFTPVFRANITDYYTSLPYDLLLVKIWAFAQYCYSEARLVHKYGVARPSLYTLGLGLNKLLVHVVDTTHTDPWIVSTYTLNIHRDSPSRGKTQESPDTKRKACSLTQDCDLKYIPGAPCGLQNSSFNNWMDFLAIRTKLPACVSGDIAGEWIFPCVTCSNRDTCSWDDGIWQPQTCTHPVVAKYQLKQCLAGKQVIFIGDSTNRGMMHYVMEKVNDSLTEWDKTHDMKFYNNINDDRTTFSFGYYPQFWLPANQRPVFDKALYDLLKQSEPVENNQNTVLIVGGVHWLSTHHLNVLSGALKRESLTGVKVIMKGLGAGFHQPVDGLHCLTLREQRKLLLHSQGLNRLAQELGYGVVDTFNMTMARFKDFLQGKCACHFHTVKESLPSFTEYLKTNSQRGESGYSDMPIHYHIEGQINRAYSDILVNYMCDQYRH